MVNREQRVPNWLIAVDNSDETVHAVEFAAYLYNHIDKGEKPHILMIYVVPIPRNYKYDKNNALQTNHEGPEVLKKSRELFESIVSSSPEISTKILFGKDPNLTILNSAEETRANYIVMGSYEKTRLPENIMSGDVVSYITKHSQCPVTVMSN